MFAIFGSLLTLPLIAVGAKASLWPKLHKKPKANTKPSYFVTPAYVTPLYVHRMTQARIRLAQRRVTQVCLNNGLPQDNNSNIDKQVDNELWKKRREKIRQMKKERLAKGPRNDPEKLKRINHEWRLFYGFKSRDLFHVENELDNTVAKVPCVDSTKRKSIKFDDSVNVVFIEKNNTGRRMSRWKAQRHESYYACSEFTSDGDTIV